MSEGDLATWIVMAATPLIGMVLGSAIVLVTLRVAGKLAESREDGSSQREPREVDLSPTQTERLPEFDENEDEFVKDRRPRGRKAGF